MSGDNDVGGENGLDPKEDWKVKRFSSTFASNVSTAVKFLEFFKVHFLLLHGCIKFIYIHVDIRSTCTFSCFSYKNIHI